MYVYWLQIYDTKYAMGWAVQGSNPCGCEIFRTRPDHPWGQPSLLYNGYRVFLGVKRPGRSIDPTPPYSTEVKERGVGLHGLF